jgi:beta-N-acetylhexosaminidase
MRHGMTLGELARYMNAEYTLSADLHVIGMDCWQRDLWFDETGLPWVPTSPAMPHLSTAILYPGMCLLEGTNLSLGRGTALPFEVCGAPWIHGYALAEALNDLQLPGVRFRATVFTPSASNQAGSECHGVQVHITDRDSFRPVGMALHLLAVARRLSGDAWLWNPHFERLAGGSDVRSALEAGTSVAEMIATWEESISAFLHQREKYLMY